MVAVGESDACAPSGFSVFFFSDTSFASASTMFMYSSNPCDAQDRTHERVQRRAAGGCLYLGACGGLVVRLTMIRPRMRMSVCSNSQISTSTLLCK